MQIRKLTPDDAAPYHELRLEGLRKYPYAFGESQSEFEVRTIEEIAEMIPADPDSTEGFILGAFDEQNSLIGIVSLSRNSFKKRAHKAVLWGMYIRTEYHRKGIGAKLVEQLVALARQFKDLEQIELTAATNNERAIQFYESLGFRSFGREPRALQIDGKYYDQEHMCFDL